MGAGADHVALAVHTQVDRHALRVCGVLELSGDCRRHTVVRVHATRRRAHQIRGGERGRPIQADLPVPHRPPRVPAVMRHVHVHDHEPFMRYDRIRGTIRRTPARIHIRRLGQLLPAAGDLALVGTHILRVEPDIGRHDNGPVDRGRRGWHLRHIVIAVDDSRTVFLKTIPIIDADDAGTFAVEHSTGRVFQSEQLDDAVIERPMIGCTELVTRRNRLAGLLLIRQNLVDDPVHLIGDLTGRRQVHQIRLITLLPQFAREREHRSRILVGERFDRMVLVIRTPFARMELDLHEPAPVGGLRTVGEPLVRAQDDGRGRLDRPVLAADDTRLHLRAGGQCAQRGEHVLRHVTRLVVIGERHAVHRIQHALPVDGVRAVDAEILRVERREHLAGAQHAEHELAHDEGFPVAAMPGQHVGELFERFQPGSGEHAHEIPVGFLVHGQPPADAFRGTDGLRAPAGGVECLRDGEILRFLADELDDVIVATHPHARVDADATFDLREPFVSLRLTQDRRHVCW